MAKEDSIRAQESDTLMATYQGGNFVAVATDKAFDLQPGDRITRKELHERWGGRTQGGISPSASTPNIFIFWSPALGEKHGYYDEFRSDGCFYYTGKGQYGDQEMHD